MPHYDYPSQSRDTPSGFWNLLAGMLIVTAINCLGLWAFGLLHFGGRVPDVHNPNAIERTPVPRSEHNSEESERIRLYKTTMPSVVNVDTLAYSLTGYLEEEEKKQGTGSGFFWDDEGRIVTNFHVVRDALALTAQGKVVINDNRQIKVSLASGETTTARLVGIAPDNDLAVIQLTKMPEGGVRKIALGTSSDLEVGQTVYAIGSPFGQSFTLTSGIISALGRSIQSPSQHIILGVIQTDASLNPGNSGGPLLDKDGRLIGVNAAITSPTGGSVGLGYAIPVDTVNKVVTELIRTGRVAQPYIGAEYVLEESAVRQMGIVQGVVVRRVRPGSPAAASGLRSGDIIIAVDKTKIIGLADLDRALGGVKVGDALTFTIRRKRQELEIAIQVEGI